MKKSYTKPEIMFESFTMSTNIAACEVPYYGFGNGTCAIEGEGDVKFFSESAAGECNYEGTGLGITTDDGFCYDIPTAGNVLFNS